MEGGGQTGGLADALAPFNFDRTRRRLRLLFRVNRALRGGRSFLEATLRRRRRHRDPRRHGIRAQLPKVEISECAERHNDRHRKGFAHA